MRYHIFKHKIEVDLRRAGFYRPLMKKILLAILIALALLSCSGDKNEVITITWWHFWTDAKIKPVIDQIVSDFEANHSGVKVKQVGLTWTDGHDKIAIAFSAGSGPDVVELGSDWVTEFSSTGHLFDISEISDSIRSDYLMWDPARYGSGVYAFPWILGTRILFGNQALIEKAGQEPTYMPGDWDDLYDVSHRINQLSKNIYGFGSNSAERHRLYKKFLPFLWSNGGSILSKDLSTCQLNSDPAVDALEYYIKLCRTGITDTQRRLEDMFIEGGLGFVISGDWLLKRIAREKPDFRFNCGLIPEASESIGSVSFAGGEYLAINERSEEKELAWQLVRHISSPENQLKFCLANKTANPSSRQAASDSTLLVQPYFVDFVAQIETSRMPPPHAKWVYIEAELEKAIEAVLYETKTARQALDDACVAIDEILIR